MVVNALRHAYYYMPQPFQRAVLVRRRAPIWLSAGTIFIHIPKAAGTSISEALYGRFVGHVRATDIARWGSPSVKLLPRFAITRNPWDRLVSAYRFVTRGGGVGGAYAGQVWRAGQYRVPELETFERFVIEWLAPRDLRTLDVAFQPQSLFVCDDQGEVIVDRIGRYEELAESATSLDELIPGLASIPNSNRSGARIDYRGFYTPELVDLVGAIYRTDVERFGYDFS